MTLQPSSSSVPTAVSAASRPSISVVICVYTFDRWDLMLKAIESVRRQTHPVVDLLVVVDHNRELRDRLVAHDPALRVVENAQVRGLSGARNTGVAETSGELVAFLDDDAEAAPDWIAVMARHFVRRDVITVGSRVDPAWIGQPRSWFPAEFLWVIGCSYRGQPEQTSPVRNVIGGSMLIRRSVFEQVGVFNHRLGRTESGLPLGGEETELCIRATQAMPGSVILYEPGTFISHHVSTQRKTWSYLGRRCYAEGLSKATLVSLVQSQGLASERRHTLVVLPRGVLRGLGDAFLRGDLSGLGRAIAIVYGLTSAVAGYIVGRWQLGSSRGAGPAQRPAGP